jgi:acetyl-CoA carboxylase carboxyl transferase subunit alpha
METPSYSLEFEKPLRDLARQLDELRQQSVETHKDVAKEARALEKKIEVMQKELYSSLTPWQKVLLARHPKRPYALDYLSIICKGFQELHGDRQFSDDRALIGGTAFFGGQRGDDPGPAKGPGHQGEDRPEFRDAAARGLPQGAEDLVRMAEKFSLPVISLIDTPGAYPGS